MAKNKMPKNLSMSRRTVHTKRQVPRGSWIPGDETDLTRIKRELRGRTGSDIIHRVATKGLSQKNIEDRIKTVLDRIKKEQRRIQRLKDETHIPDSYLDLERKRKIAIKETICVKLTIAAQIMEREYHSLERRAETRELLKKATKEDQLLVRLPDNKFVPTKEPDYTPSTELRPTGTEIKKVMVGRKPAARSKYSIRLAEKATKAEMAETERKERIRKQAILREYEEFSKFKEPKFEIIKKRQPKHLQDEIDRVFGLTEEDHNFNIEDMEKIFGED